MRITWRDPQPITQQDLAPYIEVINRHIAELINDMKREQFLAALTNREGSNHMTITTENTTQTVTLDTADGTVIRLIDGSNTHADAGALGVVDRTLTTDQGRYLPVSWLKGHEKDGMSQMNGGYEPETFEVCEFQVGDRVRVVNSQFEFGHEGVISSIPATNGDDCIVAVDFPRNVSLSYLFDRLEKVEIPDPLIEMRDALMRAFGQAVTKAEPEVEQDDYEVGDRVQVTYGHEEWDGPATVTQVTERIICVKTDAGREGGFERNEVEPLEDDCCASYYEDDYDEAEDYGYDEEPLAEWEKELLYGGEPADLQPGDIAVIDLPANRLLGDEMDMSEWDGLRFVVGTGSNDYDYELVDGAIDTRPDKYDGNFYWPKGQVRRFEACDFAVGDIVESLRFGKNGEPAKAVVTRLDGEFGGDIEVNWTEGLDTLVAYGPIGARREHLTLVGVEAEPEPVFEDFTFEAGQEIGSSDVLDDLPLGTVLVVNGDEASPIIRLGGGFGRLNRWEGKQSGRSQPMSYFEDMTVQRAADGAGSLVIAFVPTV